MQFLGFNNQMINSKNYKISFKLAITSLKMVDKWSFFIIFAREIMLNQKTEAAYR